MSFKVITYNVEHGSCHALITPNNQLILIDAGSRDDFSPALHLKNIWGFERLRWLTITHHDSDHLTDINNIAEFFKPGTLNQPFLTPEQLSSLYPAGFSTPLEVFLEFRKEYNSPALPISDLSYDWGGVQFTTFRNEYLDLLNPSMNDLSIVIFAHYQGWTFCLPGDIEKIGWKKLLEKEEFRNWISRTSILVASHHGRESGFCEEVFKFCSPYIVLISDKNTTSTSCTEKYLPFCSGLDVTNPLGVDIKRHVLTTRNDGAVTVDIDDAGRYKITTS